MHMCTVYCKVFEVETFAVWSVICWKTFAVRRQSLIDIAYCTGYFTGKVLSLSIDVQKQQNCSTVNR